MNLRAASQVSFNIYYFQSGALFPLNIESHRVEGASTGLKSNQRESGPGGERLLGSCPDDFLMCVVLTIHFEYSFDAVKHEKKQFETGPHKTRELAANQRATSNIYISRNFLK